MPITRSSGRPSSNPPSGQPYSTRRAGLSGQGDSKKSSEPPSNQIIVLSSDDDEPSSKGNLSSKKVTKRVVRKKVVPSVNPRDVLEISSEDESHSKKSATRKRICSPEKANRELQNTIKKLQEELKRSEQLLASTSKEVEELKRNYSHKDILSGLEEYTTCGVCTLTMWRPYTLPQCGHSFCENCLVDWFSTIQVQHLTANPQLEGNRAALAAQIQTLLQMLPNIHAYGPHGPRHLQAILDELRRHRPEYTCPSCRKTVLNKPIEDFRLKDLIREIGRLLGGNDSREHAPLRASGPFDNFFAAPIPVR